MPVETDGQAEDFSSDEKVKMVLEGLRDPDRVDELCRAAGISNDTFSKWHDAFLAGGQRQLSEKPCPEASLGGLDEELYGKIVESFPGNILVSGLDDGEILYRSASTQATFGLRERTSEHWMDQNEREVFVSQMKKTGRVNSMLFRARDAEGNEFPAQLSGQLIEHNGRPVSITTSTDLSNVYKLRTDREQADNRLRDAIEALGDGFILYDENDSFVMANERYREMLAPYEASLEHGTHIAEVIGPAVEDGFLKFEPMPELGIMNTLHQIKVDEPYQTEAHFADGSQKIVNLTRLSDGGLAATFFDITTRRNAQILAKEMLSDIIESLDEGLSLYDSDLKFVMRNGRRYEMLSEQQHDIKVGQHLADVTRFLGESGKIALRDGESPEQWSSYIVEQTKQFAKNIAIDGTDGRQYYLSVHRTKLSGYLLVFKDVTEQLQAERAQREADTLLKLIVDACPVNFMVTRVEDGSIIYRSQASKVRFGEIDSARSFFLNPEDRLTYLDALLPTGVVDDYPVKFRKGDGSVMDGLTSARITSYKGEDVIVSSTRDVTDFLQLQLELRHQREIAHQNEKLLALGELLAGVAHELNNPLSVVVGYSLMLKQKVEDPVHRERIDRIGQAAERCARIVKTFLTMARQRPLNPEPVSLNDVIETTIDNAGVALRSKGARIVFDLDSTLPLVDAEEDQLIQVFSNLIANARHALASKGEDGVLTLKTYFDAKLNRVVAEVADNGPGVPDDLKSRIFEPFFTTKEAGEGTGIGLAFCHRIIDTFGGRLSLKSSPSKGARFIIRLPESEHGAGEFSNLDELKARTISSYRILVVDDEVGVTEMLVDLLEEDGFQVDARNDARTALSLLERKSFDAILSDIRMPGCDGETFLKELRASYPQYDGRFAFVTGDVMSPDVADFLRGANVPHIEKPIVPEDLQSLIAKLCTPNEGAES
ncbi:MAG: PAS-domain containing protein [Rhizobiaceae bacterium]